MLGSRLASSRERAPEHAAKTPIYLKAHVRKIVLDRKSFDQMMQYETSAYYGDLERGGRFEDNP